MGLIYLLRTHRLRSNGNNEILSLCFGYSALMCPTFDHMLIEQYRRTRKPFQFKCIRSACIIIIIVLRLATHRQYHWISHFHAFEILNYQSIRMKLRNVTWCMERLWKTVSPTSLVGDLQTISLWKYDEFPFLKNRSQAVFLALFYCPPKGVWDGMI